MAATFTKTNGDLRAVMETLLFSREFMSEGAWQAKVKTPLELVTSAVRGLDAHVGDATALAQQISEMGQPLYGRVDPSGYPMTADAWSGSAGLLRRMAFATALAAGQISGVKVDALTVAERGTRRAWTDVAGYEPSPDTLAAIEEGAAGTVAAASVVTAAIIGSPDFQKR
jgi:uncharacterized protein (DUF1800 family)